LALMGFLAGGAALRESVTFDEVAHIGAGVSYWQKLDLRFNEEHPPLAKVIAAIPLILRGTRADYSHISWTNSTKFLPHAFVGEWVFGEWLLTRWNDPVRTLAWARLPMLMLTLILGWVVFVYARRLGGDWGGLLSVAAYVSTPTFIVFGPLVLTDLAVTLFCLLTLWRFADLWQELASTLGFARRVHRRLHADAPRYQHPALQYSTHPLDCDAGARATNDPEPSSRGSLLGSRRHGACGAPGHQFLAYGGTRLSELFSILQCAYPEPSGVLVGERF